MATINTLICIGSVVNRRTLDVFVSDGRIHFDLIVPIVPEAFIFGENAWKVKYRGFSQDSVEVEMRPAKDKQIYTFTTDGVPRPLFIAVVERFPFARFVMYSVSDDGERCHVEGRDGRLTRDYSRNDPEAWV